MKPKLNNYEDYKKFVNKLSFYKQQLHDNVIKLRYQRSRYLGYLEANPFKKEKDKLENEVKKYRKKILQMIPKENGF